MADQAPEKLDNLLSVRTPENISFQYRLGGPLRRLIAHGLDLLFSLGGYAVIAILILIVISWVSSMLGVQASRLLTSTAGSLLLVGYFFVFWFYGAFMEMYYNGRSLGKMVMKLRVLRSSGEGIDGSEAILRNLFRLMDYWPFVPAAFFLGAESEAAVPLPTLICGLFVMTISPKFQRVGDLIADTIVVHEQRQNVYGLAQFDDPRVSQLAELLPADFYVNASMAKALAKYVDRRRFLPYARVQQIASHLAVPLIQRFGLPADTNFDLMLCSLYYRTFVSSQSEEVTSAQPIQSMVQTVSNTQGYDSKVGYG